MASFFIFIHQWQRASIGMSEYSSIRYNLIVTLDGLMHEHKVHFTQFDY